MSLPTCGVVLSTIRRSKRMGVINTTGGPVEIPRGTFERHHSHTLNTSHVYDEDEIIGGLPGTGWCAVIGEESVPLVAFVAMDTGRMYGVALADDGTVDLIAGDVEENSNFQGYKQVNSNQ
jgi:hypothetical protein